MATLTVRNLDDDLVKRLRIRAAQHGRSAEAEHREILKATLSGADGAAEREDALARLAAFRQRTAGRGGATSAELLGESRRRRTGQLAGEG